MLIFSQPISFPVGIYLFKVNNKSTRKRCKIKSKLNKNLPKKVIYKTYPIRISIHHLARKMVLVWVMPNFKSLQQVNNCDVKFQSFHNKEKRRNQGQIQEPCRILDEALCNSLPLIIVTNSFILNMTAEFLDLALKTSQCTKTNLVLCYNQSFYSLFWNVVTFIKTRFIFLY